MGLKMDFKYKRGDCVLVKDPIRIYKITGAHEHGYNATYIGPGKQTIDNALVLIEYRVAHNTDHVRLATSAEMVLYSSKI